ncbi:TetR/AcrR family transcriptional regulator [Angelakisella massiliensis]|uniref:TetR/AcrR family transcriptional regulator n=1 Tax=Angelakisella massiliensis TaxID=1871018 RepID=UPI0008F8E77E|nr:TetR/AcrR family transcriptional regulator [Angelakisella massiliensis]
MPKKAFFKLSSKAQAEIIETAIDVYTEEKFENITIRTLSEQLNISIGSFYDYFYDKDELYFYIFDSLINRLLFSGYYKNRMFSVPRPDLRDYLSQREIQFYNTFSHAPEYMMKKYYFNTEVSGIYFEYVHREFERMKREGKIRDEFDVDFLAYIYVTISFNVAMYFERNFPGEPIEQKYVFCNQVYNMIQNGIFQKEPIQSEEQAPAAEEE